MPRGNCPRGKGVPPLRYIFGSKDVSCMGRTVQFWQPWELVALVLNCPDMPKWTVSGLLLAWDQ